MVEVILEVIPLRFLRIESERVLTLFCEFRIETPQMPLTTGNGTSLFCLAASHTALDLQTVVDTWSVGNDE